MSSEASVPRGGARRRVLRRGAGGGDASDCEVDGFLLRRERRLREDGEGVFGAAAGVAGEEVVGPSGDGRGRVRRFVGNVRRRSALVSVSESEEDDVSEGDDVDESRVSSPLVSGAPVVGASRARGRPSQKWWSVYSANADAMWSATGICLSPMVWLSNRCSRNLHLGVAVWMSILSTSLNSSSK